MELFYRTYGEGKPFVILHGLFGFSDNWNSMAKKISEYFFVITVDLRNHGHSPWSEDFSYELMAEDLKELFDTLKLDQAIVMGHSMGGKTAITFYSLFPDLVERLIVVDMGIKAYPPHHTHILQAIDAVNLDSIKTRREAEEILKKKIDSFSIIQFLLKNLHWLDKEKLAWRMNIDVLKRRMNEILKKIELSNVPIPSLFIIGECSNYVLEEDIPVLENIFLDAKFQTIDNAGHWVHAENPNDFLMTVLAFSLR